MISKKALFEFFKISPTPSLVLYPDAPKFTIAEVNDAYLEATSSKRIDLIGKGIFEAFPDNDSDPTADGVKNLSQSLHTVIKTNKKHKMAIQKYDIPIRGTSEFELKYWEPENIPLFSDDEQLNFIIHCVRDVTEKITAKKQVKEFEYFFTNSNDFSGIANNEGYFEIINSSFNKVLGYSQNELATRPFIDFVHPDDIESTMLAYDQLKSGVTVIHFVNRYRKKSGEYIWLDWTATPNLLTKKLYCIARDVTEQKIAQNEIVKANKKFSSIFNFSPVAIAITKIDGQFIQVNDAFCKTTGYKRENLIGKKSVDVKMIDSDARERMVAQITREQSRIEDIEGTLRKPNGEQLEVFYRAERIEIDGQPCFITALIDITALKKTEGELNRLNEELEQRVKERTKEVEKALKENNIILESIGDAFFAVDKKWTVTYWNRIAERDLSVLKQDILGKNLWEMFADSTDSESYRKYHEALASNEVVHFEDYYLALNKWYEISAYPSENGLAVYFKDITENKKAKKLIEESNERFEYVTKATFDAIWDWNLEEDKIFWGDGFEKIFGYKTSQLKDDSSAWTQNIHPEDIEKITESYYNIVKSKETNWIEEYRYKKSNGQYAYVINKGIVIRNADGRTIRIIGAMQDITKKKEEESRLKLLETVITNTNDAIVIKEANPSSELGREIVYVNNSFIRMTGYSESEIIGKTHGLLQGPNSNDEELARFYRALDDRNPTESTIINYKKNGEEFWVHLALNPVFNEKGIHTHWVSIERDVTERKKQEKELAEINQKLFDTLESIQDGFYTLDKDWNVTYWNREAERISGKSGQEMFGKNFWEVYEGQISKQIYSKFHNAKNQNKPVRLEVYSKEQNNWYELNAFPSSLGLTVYFKDITGRKQTESKLKKMNRALEIHVKELAVSNEELEQFAYVASHDLQEPLRMITGFLSQIEKKYENVLDEKGKKYIFFAVDGAKRMRQIILDLLEFSRIGKEENKLEEVNLNEVLDEIVLLYRKKIEEKKAKINYGNLPKLKNYSAPIKHIFQNLISNSLKYSKSDLEPIITITSEETLLAWKFAIRDNGIGINSEYFEKIFIIFQRLHNKDEYSGTGMGLAITKKIVENLGGQIWLESEEGIGTTFYFTIPKKQTKKL